MNATLLTPPAAKGDYSDPGPFAVDAAAHTLYAATGFGVSVIDTELDVVNRNISLPAPPSDLVFDPLDGRLLSTDGSIRVVNVSSGALVDTINACNGSAYRATFDPASSSIYVGCLGPADIEIFNATTLKPVANLSLFHADNPEDLTYDQVDDRIFVADDDGNVSVLNGTTNQLAFPTSRIAMSLSCSGLAVDQTNGLVYVEGGGSNISVIYPGNFSVAAVQLAGGPSPNGATIDLVDNRLYVADQGLPAVTIDNLTSGALVRTVWLSASYFHGAFDQSNGLVYIADADSLDQAYPGSITVVQPGPSPRVVANITVGGTCPERVAVDPSSNRIFVSDYCNNSVTIIDGNTNRVVGPDVPVGVGPMGIAYDNRSGLVYVTSALGNSVWAINASSLKVTAKNIPTGANPDGVAIDPRTDTVWVANYGSNNLSSINGSSLRPNDVSLSTGSAPSDLLFDSQNNDLYCANTGSDTIQIFDSSTVVSVGNVTSTGGPVALALASRLGLLFAANAVSGTVTVVNTSNQSAVGPAISLHIGANPQGLAYIPNSNQLDVFDEPGAIDIVADSPFITNWAGPNNTDVGLPISLTTSVTDGSPPLTYSYVGFPASCPSANSSAIRCTFPSAGIFRLGIRVVDAEGYFDWAERLVTVHPPPQVLEVQASPSEFDVGFQTQITVDYAGGGGYIGLSYSGLPPGCPSENLSTLNCTPTSTGTFAIVADLLDSVGGNASAVASMIVNPTLRATATVGSADEIQLGAGVSLSIAPIGGTAPYRFATMSTPPGCAASNLSAFICTPNATGSFAFGGHVSDADGETAGFDVSLLVLPVLGPIALADVIVTPVPVVIGGLLTFNGEVLNGSAPYEWSFSGLPPGCAPASTLPMTCRPNQAGTYSVLIAAIDAKGRSTSAYAVAVVIAPSARTPTDIEITVALIVGIGVTGVASFAYWFRRKRR
ncbi:MAG: YncE family protein [Thermoplasmata archaeon]|nr:YncE family protein [Thermoplasmata archaeon]